MIRFVRFLSIAILVACTGTVAAQTNITIHGEVVDGAGKEVFLYRYTDMLTRTEVMVDHSTINTNRTFELKAYANYPTMMMLQIENYSQSFFVEPGREYEVYVPRFDWNIDEKKNIFLSPEVLPLEFVNMPADELNGLISNFEAVVADYIDNHRVYFDGRFRPQKRYFDSLEIEVRKKAPDTRNEFYNRYKRYQLASMKYSFHFDTRRNMANRFVKGQPILYYDDNYMSFFFTLFANSDKVLQMIDLLGSRTKFPEHKTLARQLAASLRQQEQGVEMPSFTLPDVDKNMVSLDSMKGKWVYITFVRVGDKNCISELETMAHFKDSVYSRNKNVEFVTVCCDREFQTMYNFLKNSKRGRKYNWTWLHFNGNYRLLEHYQVVSYPHFILINPDGQLQYTITPAPATGFLMHGPWQTKQEQEERPFFLRY